MIPHIHLIHIFLIIKLTTMSESEIDKILTKYEHRPLKTPSFHPSTHVRFCFHSEKKC